MRKIMTKDLRREIVKSFPRFISIALLIGIGVTFFIGFKAAPRIMTSAGANYLENHHFIDLKVFSNYEITTTDVAEIKKLEMVEDVTWHNQLYLNTLSDDLVTEIVEYTAERFEITEGRGPNSNNEIVLDAKGKDKYKIGDIIAFKGDDGDYSKHLTNQMFKIVGFCNSYEYLDIYDRGNASIGDGSLFMFAAILPDSFSEKSTRNLSIVMNKKMRVDSVFSEEYLNLLENETISIEKIIERQQDKKKENLSLEIVELKRELSSQKKQLEKQLNDVESENNKAEIIKKLENITQENDALNDRKENIDTISFSTQSINKTQSFKAYRDNVQQLDVLGNTIPFIFFFVSCLITCVIIISMINQEKKQIGTLKAIGVSRFLILKKYVLYPALSAVLGFGVGLYGGIYYFPKLLIQAYSASIVISKYPTIIYLDLVMASLVIVLIVIVIVPFFFYKRVLNEEAIELLRPSKVKEGKQNIIEKSPKLWAKLPFPIKMGIRNLLFYKFKMFLIFVGLVGCLSLLISGFGTRNSVNQLYQKQFKELQKYSTVISVDQGINDQDREKLEKNLIKDYTNILANKQEVIKIEIATGKKVGVLVVSPKNNNPTNNVTNYFTLLDSETKQQFSFKNNQVAISYKLATLLNVEKGKSIQIKLANNTEQEVTITNVFENHYEHLLFIGEDIYNKITENQSNVTNYWIIGENITSKERKKIINYPGVIMVSTREQIEKKIGLVINQLELLVLVVIIFSALLGFIVVYDLAYLSILERKQEIAILETIGKNSVSVSIYMFKELLFLLLLTFIFGSFTGLELHKLVMKQLELDFLSLPDIQIVTVLSESAITLSLVFLVVIIYLHNKIKKVNIIESLKERI